MRTNIVIDDQLMQAAMSAGNFKTKKTRLKKAYVCWPDARFTKTYAHFAARSVAHLTATGRSPSAVCKSPEPIRPHLL